MIRFLLLAVVFVLISGLLWINNKLVQKDSRIPIDSEDKVDDIQSTINNKNDAPDTTESPVDTSFITIDLSYKNLTKTPTSIFEETKIEKLDISHNQITGSLQAEVRHLSSLRSLDLSDNRFTGVPAEIGQLVNLEILDLSNNQITGLPYELGNLHNLKLLDLRGNNYAKPDLEIIKKNLPANVEILTD